MPTAYLHVGMHKTGTSAFQDFCHTHRDALRAAGLAYPHLPLRNHSSFLEAQFRRNAESTRTMLERRGHAVFFEKRADMWRTFEADAEAAAAAGLDLLVSGETASQLGREEAKALTDALGRWFERVIVLGLVRPPLSFARSAAQQRLRGGITLPGLAERLPGPNYRARFHPYDDAVGRGNVRLRLFARETLAEGCVLQTLLAMTDGDRSALAAARAPRLNESLSATAAKFLSLLFESLDRGALAEALPPRVAGHLKKGFCGAYFEAVVAGEAPRVPLAQPILTAVLAVPGPPFALPREIAERLEAASARDDAWISARLGQDVRDYDRLPGAAVPTLADMRRFDEAEEEALAHALERVNDTVKRPYARMMRRADATNRKRAALFLKAQGESGATPAAGKRPAPASAPPGRRPASAFPEARNLLGRALRRIARSFRRRRA